MTVNGATEWGESGLGGVSLSVVISVRLLLCILLQGTQIKDVIIKPDAVSTLLLDKHADYIAAYGSKKDDYVSPLSRFYTLLKKQTKRLFKRQLY